MWCGGLRVSSLNPYLYHPTTYLIPCPIFTLRILPLATYSSGTMVSSLVTSFAFLRAFRCCYFRCRSCATVVISYGWSVTWAHVGYNAIQSMKMIFGMLPSSLVTQCSWTLRDFYGPGDCRVQIIALVILHFIRCIWHNSGDFVRSMNT